MIRRVKHYTYRRPQDHIDAPRVGPSWGNLVKPPSPHALPCPLLALLLTGNMECLPFGRLVRAATKPFSDPRRTGWGTVRLKLTL